MENIRTWLLVSKL